MKTRNLRDWINRGGMGYAFFARVVAGLGRSLAALGVVLGLGLIANTAFAGDKVEQPIEFPHDIHAGKMGINCMYCHTYARRSRVSGIPPLRKCINCHTYIPSVRNKPRIKKLFQYWEEKKPIPFMKVHDLPDFVRFPHMRHIQRFYFELHRPVKEVCSYCHGDVENMTVDQKVKPLSMGWCISCHQKNHPLPKDPKILNGMRMIYPRMEMSTHPEQVVEAMSGHGPNDCWQCHK